MENDLELYEEDDGVVVIPIPVDRKTLARLCELAKAVDAHPRQVASSLLHDVVHDDWEANVAGLIPPTTLNS